jgi:cell division control protein 7
MWFANLINAYGMEQVIRGVCSIQTESGALEHNMIETAIQKELIGCQNDSSVSIPLSNQAVTSVAPSSTTNLPLTRKRRRTRQSDTDSVNGVSVTSIPDIARHFTVLEKIGEGTFSSVYKCHVTENSKKLFALKHIVPTSAAGRISHELQCLQALRGQDNIIAIETCLRWRDNVVIVLPYFCHDRFTDYLADMDVSEMRLYMQALFVALRRVHSMAIIHRDIKPSNFLFNRKTKQ